MSRMFWTAVLVVGVWTGTLQGAFGPNYRVIPNPVRVDQGQRQATFEDVIGGGELKIFNAAGRIVLETTIDAGATSFVWNLKNNDGRDVASGIYIWFLSTTGETRTGKVGIIR